MFQKQKFQNQKFSTPMNLQQNHNALATQKIRRFVFQRCQNLRNIQYPRPEARGNYQFVITLLRQKHSSANSLVQRPLPQ